jgi:hypothetical protein
MSDTSSNPSTSTTTATALARYDAMCSAITAAYEVDEVKEIRDQALALEYYSRQAKNTDNERRACEIRLRAERKAGQLLAQQTKRGGDKRSMSNRSTLKKNKITRDQSSTWQKLARVPEERFEASLATMERPTTRGIIEANAAPKQNPVSSEALWLWGRLRDFERDGLLAKEPTTVMTTMTDQMKNDVNTLAPKVVAWLTGIADDEGDTPADPAIEARVDAVLFWRAIVDLRELLAADIPRAVNPQFYPDGSLRREQNAQDITNGIADLREMQRTIDGLIGRLEAMKAETPDGLEIPGFLRREAAE